MNTTWLLFKTQRRGLFIGGTVCFLIQLLLVWADVRASDLDKAALIQVSALAYAFFASVLAGFHAALFKLPFPVTYRQLGWIPTICFALLWAAGFVGVLAGMALVYILDGPSQSLLRWGPLCVVLIEGLPIAFLVFAIADRLLRYFGLSALGVLPCFFIPARHLGQFESVLAIYHFGWPLCIILGIFFILEAPVHVAAMEYPVLTKQGLRTTTVRAPGAAFRTPPGKACADLLMALFFLLVALLWISTLDTLPNLGPVSTTSRALLAAIGVGALLGILFAWPFSQANGFGPKRTMAIFLMKCSLVLVPITWLCGAKRGAVATCLHCRNYKFLWARHCPHCGHANRGIPARIIPLPPWKRDKGTPPAKIHMSPRMGYRVILPAYLAWAILFGGNSGHFRTESFTVTPTQQGLVSVFDEIGTHLALLENTRDWMNAGSGTPVRLPGHFRIEAHEEDTQALVITCYWPRWEDADGVGEQIKKRLLEAFPEPQFNTSRVRKYDCARASVGPAALSSFLDGAIHWTGQ